MSPLTKAFVVLVTVLAVVLVALVVPFVANTQNYQGEITDLKQQLGAANRIAAQRQEEVTAAREDEAVRAANLNSQINSLTDSVHKLQGELHDALARLNNERARVEESKGAIARFSAAAEQQGKLLSLLNDQLQQTRADLVTQRTKSIQLSDRVNAVTTERDSLTRQVRHIREKMTGLEQELEQFQAMIAQLPDDVRVPSPVSVQTGPAEPVAGQITDVQKIDGATLVQVDVGRNDQITEGFDFIVHRGGTWIGKLRIDTVDVTDSAGRMLLEKDETPVQVGDQIYAGPY